MTNGDLAIILSWVALVAVALVLVMVVMRYRRKARVPDAIVVAALSGAVFAAISGAVFVTGELLLGDLATLDISSVFRFGAIIIWSGLIVLLNTGSNPISRVFQLDGPDEDKGDS